MKQIIIDRMNDRLAMQPDMLVDYADENEINDLHAALHHMQIYPAGSAVREWADDFLEAYHQRCVDRYHEKNYLPTLAEYEAELNQMEADRIKDERLEAALEATA